MGTGAYRLTVPPYFRVSLVPARHALHTDCMRDLWQGKEELWVRNGWLNLAYNSTSTLIVGIFYILQSCDMGPMALLPLRRKARWGFSPEKSDSFGQVWTRELGYQRPACQPLDHQSCLLFILSLLNYHIIPRWAWVEWRSTPLHPGLPTVNSEV
jgi:hypothetical protein